MKTLLTFAIAMIIAIACFGFTDYPVDVGAEHVTQANNMSAPDTAVSPIPGHLDAFEIVQAHRVESAVNTRTDPVPATRFARQQFDNDESDYQSRTIDVEVPPNRHQPETSNHRAREDV